MRPGNHLSAAAVRRVQEAASSWLLLWQIWNQFGPSTDGAVERDMLGAEARLQDAIDTLEFGNHV
jgi:hypothetical protein